METGICVNVKRRTVRSSAAGCLRYIGDMGLVPLFGLDFVNSCVKNGSE